MGPPGHYQLDDGLYEKPKSRKKTYLYSALILLLLIAAGVGIGVVVSRLGENDDSSTSTTTDSAIGEAVSSGTSDSQSGETATSTDSTSTDSTTSSGTSTSATGTAITGSATTTSSPTTSGTPPGTKDFPDPPAEEVEEVIAPTVTAIPPPTTVVPVVTPAPSPAPILAPPTIVPAPVLVVPPPEPAVAATIVSGGASNSWTTLPDVPLPMGEVGAGVLTLNNNPYLVIAGEHPKEETAKNGVTMILDLTEGEWTEGTKRPSIGNHHAAEVINNKLYLFGGLSGGEQDLQIGTLIAGTTGVDISWKMGAELPFASGSASTALIGGNVYYCGGIDKANTMTLDTCAMYNPTTNEWSTDVAPMPVGRNHAATCTDGTKMYIFGGRFGRNIVGEGFDNTQIYDPATDTWSEGTPLTVARGGMGKAVYNAGRCYVFGGEVWENEAPSVSRKITAERVSEATDIYNIGSDTWGSGKDLPVGLHGSFPVKYDGAVLLASGGVQAAYSQSQHALAYTL